MKLGRTYRRKQKIKCPYCHAEFDAETPMGRDKKPKPGDIAICLSCAAVNLYDENLDLIPPTPRQAEKFEKDYKVRLARMAVTMLIEERKRNAN